MTSSSTDAQYPSAKAVYDAFDQNERTWGAAINTLNSTLTGHTGNTDMHLPAVTSSDNGKILMVTNGKWTLTPVATIYTGSTAPDSSLGNNGDIYLQS